MFFIIFVFKIETKDEREKMKFVALVFQLLFLAILVEGDRHLNQNGPFRKRHRVGDEPSPYACDRAPGISLLKMLTMTNINVSSTSYLSNDQIYLTWTPILTSCSDDFIGIYFSEIDPSRGN